MFETELTKGSESMGTALIVQEKLVAVSEFTTGIQCPGFPPGSNMSFTPSSGSRSNTLTGWTAGGGGEWAFAPNLSVKAEYLHYDQGTMHYSANKITDLTAACTAGHLFSPIPFATVNLAPSAEFKGDLVRVGLNYKIGP